MAVFISVSANAFEESFEKAKKDPKDRYRNVRRPTRGIEVKDDTYAIIKILNADGEELPLVDSGAKQKEGQIGQDTDYSNFMIQKLDEQRVEKQQIVETFGEDFIFFFGEQPRFINVTGVLMNTNDFNWKSEFWHNYENHLRGTRLVEQNARMYLFFDDVVIEGYLIRANTSHDAMNPYHLPFQFQMFVTNYAILSNVGSIFIPEHERTDLIEHEVTGLPSSTEQIASINAATNPNSIIQPSGEIGAGGLHAFLSFQASSGGGASFSISSTLENIKNRFFGKRVNVPDGVGSQLRLPPIENRGQFKPAPRGLPIHRMLDEYPESAGLLPSFDTNEILRVAQELQLRDGYALERAARQQLQAMGIDMSRPSSASVLLGRGFFAAAQVVGSFGVRRVDGALNAIGQGDVGV